MTGIVIAGGEGTRLRPLTYCRAKPMMPVANKPLLQYQLERLREHGVTNVVFCVGVNADGIRRFFGSGSGFGVDIAYSEENVPLGTAGAIRNAEPFIKHDTIIAMNGDGLIDYDLSQLVNFHKSRHADATIGLVEVPLPTPCGVVSLDHESRVVSFAEPSKEAKNMLGKDADTVGTATANAGIYVISRESLLDIPAHVNYSIEREFYPNLIKSGGRVYGFLLRGCGLDIGAPSQYLQAHHELLSGRVNAQIAGEKTDGGYWVQQKVRIHPSAEVHPGVHIGAGSEIGPGTKIMGFTSIGPGCIIGEGSVVDGSVLLEDVDVGSDCFLKGCIVDRDSKLGNRVRLTDNSIVAIGSTINLEH